MNKPKAAIIVANPLFTTARLDAELTEQTYADLLTLTDRNTLLSAWAEAAARLRATLEERDG